VNLKQQQQLKRMDNSEKKATPLTIEDLPLEVLGIILNMFSYSDLKTLRLVSPISFFGVKRHISKNPSLGSFSFMAT
jgi:hypothetical protein